MINKANKTLGFLRRNIKVSSRTIKERAYKAYMRPLLEYAATVWDPNAQKYINRLEKFQQRAARFVLNRYHNTSSVSQMIDKLKWPTLEHRRKTARLSMMYKIRHGLVECPTLKSKFVPPLPRQRRGHDQQFNIITTRTLYRGVSFLPRTIRE